MLNKFLPKKHYKNIFEIHADELKTHGIKGVITDLDNTLVSWQNPDSTPELRVWFDQLLQAGMQVVICSNNNQKRVKRFADQVELPFVYSALKPTPIGFNRARAIMGLAIEEIVVIGDQLMTDILGGNLGGYQTILVRPIVKTDEWKTKVNRSIERKILSYFKRKGMLSWEE